MLIPVKHPLQRVNRRGESGVVLIVVAVIVLFVGVVLSLGIGQFRTNDNNDFSAETHQRQDFVVRMLSSFVQRENRLPCPADPAVAQTSAAFGTARASCATVASSVGIVPFRTLNISQSDAIDGWGRYMTYRVSPILTIDKAAIPSGKDRKIYQRCRRQAWYEHTPPDDPYNENPDKARFCCPPIDDAAIALGTDLVIMDANSTVFDGIGRTNVSSVYGDIDSPVTNTQQSTVPNYQNLFAFALISHGRNGSGAFIANGSNNRLAGEMGSMEKQNAADTPNQVFDRTYSPVAGNGYYDDIVTWRTQTGIMAELGNVSCFLPWR